MREGTIPPNCTDIVQSRSQKVAPDNIELKDTWVTPDNEEYHRETPSQDSSVTQYNNNNNTHMLLHYIPHVQ